MFSKIQPINKVNFSSSLDLWGKKGTIKQEMPVFSEKAPSLEGRCQKEETKVLGPITHLLDPSNESQVAFLRQDPYLDLENKIKVGRDVSSFFLEKCIDGNLTFYEELKKPLKELRILAESTELPLVRKFFETKGLIYGSELLSASSYDLNRYYRANKFLLVSLLKEEAKIRKISVPRKEVWDLTDIESLMMRLGDIDLEKLEEQFQKKPDFLWADLNEEKCPNLYRIYQMFQFKDQPSWSPNMNFLAKHKILHFIVEALKFTEEEIHPFNEEVSSQLDRYLDLGNLLEIQKILNLAIIEKTFSKKEFPSVKGSLKIEKNELSLSCLFKEEGWDFLQNSTFRNALLFRKMSLGAESISPFFQLFILTSSLELFYSKCLMEIKRLDMPLYFKELLDIAVSYRDTKACFWVFQKIAYQRYLDEVKRLQLDLPLSPSYSSISNVIQDTERTIEEHESLDLEIKDHLLWMLNSLSFQYPIATTAEEISFLKEKGKEYLNSEENPKKRFQKYVKLHVPLPSEWNQQVIDCLKMRYFEFIDKKIVKIEREGISWKQGVIHELEKLPLFDFEKLDRALEVLDSSTKEEALFKSFALGCKHITFFLLLKEFQAKDWDWKEILHRIENPQIQKRILKEMLVHLTLNPHFRSLMQKSFPNLQQIGYQLLEELIETKLDAGAKSRNFLFERIFPLNETELIRLFFQCYLHNFQTESDFFIECEDRRDFLENLTDWLNTHGQNSFFKRFFEKTKLFSEDGFFASKSPSSLSKWVLESLSAFGKFKGFFCEDLDKKSFHVLNEAFSIVLYDNFKESLPKGEEKEKCSKLYAKYIDKDISLDQLFELTALAVPGFSIDTLVDFKELSNNQKNHFPWRPFKNPSSALATHVQSIGINRSLKEEGSFYQYMDGISYLNEVVSRFEKKCMELKKIPFLRNEVMALEKRKEDIVKKHFQDLDDLATLIDDLIHLSMSQGASYSSSQKKDLLKDLFPDMEEKISVHTNWLNYPCLKTFEREEEKNELDGPSDVPLYTMYQSMKQAEQHLFVVLGEEISALGLPGHYTLLIYLAEQAGNWAVLDWFIKKVLYTKYEKELENLNIAELNSLKESLKDFPLEVRIEHTKEFLSKKKDEDSQALLEMLKALPIEKYFAF